jgi:simple sugar transport system permease protein
MVLMLPLMVLAGAAGGMVWAAIPGYLQARRGSHVVITTIMFNFIASAMLVYVLVHHVRPAGAMAVESAAFAPSALVPSAQQVLAGLGVQWPSSPLNASFLVALAAACGVYVFLWRTRWGFHLRMAGSNPMAAHYAGTSVARQTLIAMGISGALAGLVGLNELAGVNGKLVLEFVGGAGFTGIAVALMGRNHPVGIVLASVLFGALFQGGAEVAFDVRGFTRDMVITVQGLVVMFAGAMAYAIAPWLSRFLALLRLGETHHG